mgnify:CR=1 FL=1
MNGLTVAGNMLPAVGMAMLLQMLWDNKIAIYFLLGFILVAYLDLPLIAIAVLGTIIAVVTAQRDMQLKNNQAAPVAAVEKMSEEEDIFRMKLMNNVSKEEQKINQKNVLEIRSNVCISKSGYHGRRWFLLFHDSVYQSFL